MYELYILVETDIYRKLTLCTCYNTTPTTTTHLIVYLTQDCCESSEGRKGRTKKKGRGGTVTLKRFFQIGTPASVWDAQKQGRVVFFCGVCFFFTASF